MDLSLKGFISAIILLLMCGYATSQTVVFWTDQTRTGPIKVYMNGEYYGKITKAYSSAPDCYTSGCVTVVPPKKSNEWYAIADDGSRWSGDVKLKEGCNALRLRDVNPPPQNNTSSNSGNNENSSSNSNSDVSSAAAGAGLALAALAVAAAEVVLNSDFYVSGVLSSRYSGLEFVFRNNWNRHISFEQTVVWRYSLLQPIPNFLNTDRYESYGYNNYKRSNWGCNFRLTYNFFDRNRTFRNTNFMLNPYLGFGCDYMQYDGFFTSAVAGFTFGSRRVKMDVRYTFGYDFKGRRTAVNQLQLGLIVAYQYRRFGFFKK